VVLDPGVVVGFFRREPLRHVLLNHALQEIFCLLRVSLERLVVKVEVALDDISNDLKLRVTREGHFARKHDVQDDT